MDEELLAKDNRSGIPAERPALQIAYFCSISRGYLFRFLIGSGVLGPDGLGVGQALC